MQVIIKDEHGKYLSMTQGHVTFVDRKERAFVYDLDEDRVEEQIAIVKRTYGAEWHWEELGDVQAVDGLPRNKWDGRAA